MEVAFVYLVEHVDLKPLFVAMYFQYFDATRFLFVT